MHQIRLAISSLRRQPTFVAFAFVTLASGFAANIALMSLRDAVVQRTIVRKDADRLVAVSRTNDQRQVRALPLQTASTLLAAGDILELWCGYAGGGLFTLEARGATFLSAPEFVTAEYFRLLETRVALGRTFSSEEVTQRSHVAVISHSMWARVFDKDPNVVGSVVKVDDMPMTIVGVSSETFRGLQTLTGFDIALPITVVQDIQKRPAAARLPDSALHLIGRLRPGVSILQAQARLTSRWTTVQLFPQSPNGTGPQSPTGIRDSTVRVQSIGNGFWTAREASAPALALLYGLSVLLVALSGLNVGGLMLVRAIGHRHTYAIESALGATRGAQTASLCIQGVLIAVASIVIAIPAGSFISVSLARTIWTGVLPLSLSVTPTAPVLLRGIVTSLLLGVLGGLVAATALGRTQLTELLSSTRMTAGRRQRRLADAVVVVQIALCALLMLGAATAGRAFYKLRNVDLGVEISNLAVAKLSPQPRPTPGVDGAEYWADLLDAAARLPNVVSVSMSRFFPAVADETSLLQPFSASSGLTQTLGVMEVVGPNFFATAGIPVRVGRDFAWTDPTTTTQVILNRKAAQTLFASIDATGKYVRIGSDPKRERLEVIGVVEDATLGNPRVTHLPIAYRPATAELGLARASTLIIRTVPGAAVSARDLQKLLERGRGHYLQSMRSADEQFRMSTANERAAATLGVAFAIVASAIALGALNVLAMYSVVMRSQEFGVRAVLGAGRSQLVGLVVKKELTVTCAGLALAAVGYLTLGALIAAVIPGVAGVDGVSMALALVALAGLSGLAAAGPAMRVARLDPSLLIKRV